MATTEATQKHSHKPNFGRYVKDCPRCEEIKIEKAQAKADPPPAPVSESINLTPAQLQEMMMNVVKAARAPTEIEQKEIDADIAAKARQREDSARRQVEAEEARKRSQDNCNHRQNEGRSRDFYSIGGQIHSDGLLKPICSRCQKEFPPIQATPEMQGQAIEPTWIADVLIQRGEIHAA